MDTAVNTRLVWFILVLHFLAVNAELFGYELLATVTTAAEIHSLQTCTCPSYSTA